MKLESRIIVYNQGRYCQTLLKVIDNFLYPVTLNQEIRVLYEGQCVECKVVNIDDSVYDDAIYRYIEVLFIK